MIAGNFKTYSDFELWAEINGTSRYLQRIIKTGERGAITEEKVQNEIQECLKHIELCSEPLKER